MTQNEAIEQLESLINAIDDLKTKPPLGEEFYVWHGDCIVAMKYIFPGNPEYEKHNPGTSNYMAGSYGASRKPSQEERQQAYEKGFKYSRSFLNTRLNEVKSYWNQPAPDTKENILPVDPRKVFVIHGRQKLGDFHQFLRAIGLAPIEWSEARYQTGAPTPFTWHIFETAMQQAHAYVVLLTGDDEARLAESHWQEHDSVLEKEHRPQPRQNVLFEAGFAYAKAPKRTVFIQIGSLRTIMSDLAGHHILRLSNDPQTRQEVANALRNAGCPANTSGTEWMKAGDFG